MKKLSSLFLGCLLMISTVAHATRPNSEDYPPLLVFVSFSMPKESLHQWIAQTRRAGGAVVIRGLIDNSFRKTAEVLSPILEKESSGILLDPAPFKTFNIDKVPAVIVQQDATDFDAFYGDTTLEYALEQLKSAKTPRTALAKAALKKLRE